MRAILAALQAAPVDADLLIVTDSLSARQAILRPMVSEGRRHRSGARSLVMACRKLILLRASYGGNTSLEFVRSHTEATDWRSVGNAVADAHAARAAGPAEPFLLCEERVVFWRGDLQAANHVSGNLRDVLRGLVREDLVRAWRHAPTQGELVREHGHRLAGWLDVVRRDGDGERLLVALQMCTLQVPTPCRTLWGRPREPGALLCAMCGSISTPRHPFVCPGTAPARRVMQHEVTVVMKEAVRTLIESDTTSAAHQQLCLKLCSGHHRWLDLLCPPVFLGCSDYCDELHGLIASIESTDRWTGLCGLIPEALCALLLPPPSSNFVVADTRPVVKRVKPLVHQLQFTILDAVARVIREWTALHEEASLLPCRLPPWLEIHVPP